MAGKQSKIEIILSAKDTGIKAAFTRVQAQAVALGKGVSSITAPFRSVLSAATSLQTTLTGLAAGVGAGAFGTKLLQEASKADTAVFNLQTSVAAANKEFKVGSAAGWGQQIKTLTGELRIYSETAVAQAAAKTIDMTKRLGLSEQQMVKVIRAAANLSAGKFELSDGVERVTAALRGEAEASEALGLTLSETYVKSWYEARGAQQGAWKDLDDLQKAQIRYNILLAQSDPLLGKAAKSAGVFGGATTSLASGMSTLETAIGKVVTNNNFFVQALGLGGDKLRSLAGDVDANAASWRQWAKESALSVLEFVANSAEGLNSVYQSLSALSGTLKLAYSGTLLLGRGFQYLFEQANKLAGDDAKAAYWAQAQVDATKMVEDAMNGAAQSFANADRGSTTLTTAAEKVRALRAELSKVEAKEVIPSEDIKTTTEEIVKIGGVWKNVTKDIKNTNADTTKEVNVDWGQVWTDVEKNGVSAAKAVDEALDKATRAREAVITVRKVEGNQLGGLIGAYRNGGPIGALQALATGGGVRNILSGGSLAGFGGGDRRLLLGEDGEVMLRKESVKAGGLRAALAFNAGRFDIVLAELSKRMGTNIGYRLGGLIDSLPQMPPMMATGGALAAASGGTGYAASFTFADQSGQVGRVYGKGIDIKRLEAAVNKHNRYRSSNR